MLSWLDFFPCFKCISSIPYLNPERFSSHTLFTLGPCLAQPLGYLYKFFFGHNFVPEVWKVSFITLIHKKCSRIDPNNFRPISLTSIICRVMERIMHEQIRLLITSKLTRLSLHHNMAFVPENHLLKIYLSLLRIVFLILTLVIILMLYIWT